MEDPGGRRLWRAEIPGDDGGEVGGGEVSGKEVMDRGWVVAGEDAKGEGMREEVGEEGLETCSRISLDDVGGWYHVRGREGEEERKIPG